MSEVLSDYNHATAIVEATFRLEAGLNVGPDAIFFNELHRLASHRRLRERFADRLADGTLPEEPPKLRIVKGETS